MSVGFLIGLFVAISALAVAILHLKQDVATFYDFVGFATVLGGTFAVAIATLPWHHRRVVLRSIGRLFLPQSGLSQQLAVSDSLDHLTEIRNGNLNRQSLAGGLASEVLKDGSELIGLGFGKERIHEILEERIHQGFERYELVANSVRSLAKYPPAFGLAGTVLGLVTLMKGVSQGADAKQTGALMAIALMATFYGLLVANMVVNPAGEYLLKIAKQEKKRAEIALHAILLHLDGSTLLEAQEVLNSYVAESDRVSVLGGSQSDSARGAA